MNYMSVQGMLVDFKTAQFTSCYDKRIDASNFDVRVNEARGCTLDIVRL
jgi:hypothetical protein